MRKRTTTILTIILAGLMVMLAGCEEPLDFNVKKGESIRVKISSRRGAATKTAYSGAIYTDNGARYERIDWKEGDSLRLYSTDASLVATSEENGKKEFFDYTIDQVSTDGNRYSEATLAIPEGHQDYGLIWVNDPTNLVTVYGIYPPRDAVKNGGLITGFVDLSIPAPDLSWSGGVGTPTDNPELDSYMKHAYMVSRPAKFTKDETGSAAWAEKPYVDLDFYPIFNAFYIVLGSQKNEITLNSLTLSNGENDEPLTGDYKFSYKLRNGQDYSFDTTGPTHESIDHTGNLSHSVTVNFPEGTKISPTDSVKFTILTLPPESDSISNLTLTVNYGNPGETRTKSLKLNNGVTSSNPEGTPIQFPAFHKARITGLALDGGELWKLKVDDRQWTLVEKETTFSQNIQSGPFKISNATETENNYYPAGTKIYQVRTLDMAKNYGTTDGVPNKPYFEVEFTPQAPLGGYWMLIPESNGGLGTAAFKVEIWDEENDIPAGTDLKGHIMNQPVKFHVTSNVTDSQRTEDHAIIIKAIFSTSISFDENSTYSADSEIQDVHKDGSFSWWRFVIPQKIN